MHIFLKFYRRQDRTHQNKQFDLVNAYLARDRIGSLHLSTATPPSEAVKNITVQQFLPKADDFEELNAEFRHEIGVFLEEFSFLPKEGKLPDHKHSKESKQLSSIVCVALDIVCVPLNLATLIIITLPFNFSSVLVGNQSIQ